MDKFKIGDQEYPIVAPKGRKGRRATAFILGEFGDQGQVALSDLFVLFGSDEFESHFFI